MNNKFYQFKRILGKREILAHKHNHERLQAQENALINEHQAFLFFTGLNNKDNYTFRMASLEKESANI